MLPGQSCVLQEYLFILSPSQMPPCLSSTFFVLKSYLVPPPHVLEHSPICHSSHSQSIGGASKFSIINVKYQRIARKYGSALKIILPIHRKPNSLSASMHVFGHMLLMPHPFSSIIGHVSSPSTTVQYCSSFSLKNLWISVPFNFSPFGSFGLSGISPMLPLGRMNSQTGCHISLSIGSREYEIGTGINESSSDQLARSSLGDDPIEYISVLLKPFLEK